MTNGGEYKVLNLWWKMLSSIKILLKKSICPLPLNKIDSYWNFKKIFKSLHSQFSFKYSKLKKILRIHQYFSKSKLQIYSCLCGPNTAHKLKIFVKTTQFYQNSTSQYQYTHGISWSIIIWCFVRFSIICTI